MQQSNARRAKPSRAILIALAAVALALLLFTVITRTPQFGFPGQSASLSPELAALAELSAGPYPLAEEIVCDNSIITVFFSNQFMYCGTRGEENDSYLHCYDRRSGDLRWSSRFDDPDREGGSYVPGPIFVTQDSRHLICFQRGKVSSNIKTFSALDGTELAKTWTVTQWRACELISFADRELLYVVTEHQFCLFDPVTLELLASHIFDSAAPSREDDLDAWREYDSSYFPYAAVHDETTGSVLVSAFGADKLLGFRPAESAGRLSVECTQVEAGERPSFILFMPDPDKERIAVISEGQIGFHDRRSLKRLQILPGPEYVADARIQDGFLLVLSYHTPGLPYSVNQGMLHCYDLVGSLLQAVEFPGTHPLRFVDIPGTDSVWWFDRGAYLAGTSELTPSALYCMMLPDLSPKWESGPLAPGSGFVWCDTVNKAIYTTHPEQDNVIQMYSLDGISEPARDED